MTDTNDTGPDEFVFLGCDPAGDLPCEAEDGEELYLEEGEPDLGSCPYFLGYLRERDGSTPPGRERAVCLFGCVDEPRCITCEPAGGWPSAGRKSD